MFSIHPNPAKSKTKCIAMSKKDLEFRILHLNGRELPWVKSARHLGFTMGQNLKLKKDLTERRAIYINRVNELMQEFHFAYPLTKIKIDNIFNSYFYGSSLWNLFGSEAERLERA